MAPITDYFYGEANPDYGDSADAREVSYMEQLARQYTEKIRVASTRRDSYNSANYEPWETPPTRPAPDKPPVPATQHAAVRQELTKVREDLVFAKRELELAKSQTTAANLEGQKAKDELKKLKDAYTHSGVKPGHRPIELD